MKKLMNQIVFVIILVLIIVTILYLFGNPIHKLTAERAAISAVRGNTFSDCEVLYSKYNRFDNSYSVFLKNIDKNEQTFEVIVVFNFFKMLYIDGIIRLYDEELEKLDREHTLRRTNGRIYRFDSSPFLPR